MHDYLIRPLTAQDVSEGAALWGLVFGDEEPVVREFYRLFAQCPSFGMGAELDGHLVAAAYAPDGADLVDASGHHPGVYLYAVATHPDHRKYGLARKLCVALRDRAFASGSAYLFTKPAEESLYPWYAEKIGAQPVLDCRKLQFGHTPGEYPTPEKLALTDYEAARRSLLAGQPHVELGHGWLSWENALHGAYGGGFYRVGEAVADVYWDETSLAVQEVLPARLAEPVCQSLMAHLGKAQCSCTLPGSGEHYVSAVSPDGRVPGDNPWFGPIFG